MDRALQDAGVSSLLLPVFSSCIVCVQIKCSWIEVMYLTSPLEKTLLFCFILKYSYCPSALLSSAQWVLRHD